MAVEQAAGPPQPDLAQPDLPQPDLVAASRRDPWRAAKILAGLAVLGLGLFLLHRTLRGYSLAEIASAMAAVPAVRLAAAGGFALASYFCLTVVDYLALIYVGRPLSYGKALLASFCALAISHNVGFAGLSSGAIRYRFYARWGLGLEDLAKLLLFCGATVGLGLFALAGAALLAAPALAQGITGLSPGWLRAVCGVCLAVPLLYLLLALLVRAPLCIGSHRLRMPDVRLALAQIVLGAANFACVSACLHQALAAVTDVGYGGVVSAYVIANAATMISHVPGGLGVIEAVVRHLLPGHDLIGPLLVFRAAYFFVPLLIGSPVFLLCEALFGWRAKRAAAGMVPSEPPGHQG